MTYDGLDFLKACHFFQRWLDAKKCTQNYKTEN